MSAASIASRKAAYAWREPGAGARPQEGAPCSGLSGGEAQEAETAIPSARVCGLLGFPACCHFAPDAFALPPRSRERLGVELFVAAFRRWAPMA